MDEKLNKALDDYAVKFNDAFPMFPMSSESPDRIVEIIIDCISKNKDAYELGYVEEEVIY